MCAPIATVIGFSLMLTYIFILYQPSRGPGIKQRMGWQAWAVVNFQPNASSNGGVSPSTGNSSIELPPGGVDWWNVTKPEEKIDSANLPLDVWSPLLPHDTGCASSLFCSFH